MKTKTVSPYQNPSTTQSKENELAEISKIEYRTLLLKIISDFKEDSDK
jgi:hypothetical protein